MGENSGGKGHGLEKSSSEMSGKGACPRPGTGKMLTHRDFVS